MTDAPAPAVGPLADLETVAEAVKAKVMADVAAVIPAQVEAAVWNVVKAPLYWLFRKVGHPIGWVMAAFGAWCLIKALFPFIP